MLYIGKFINNFKDFYNEINSATLTGAIDVVVIRQPDGTYRCSPFHVRFGKIGVLRSREKVVDIEVNGMPVNIHMKLGESGEAFFVEEVESEQEIPAYLATSPLPDTPDIKAELHKMKLSTGANGLSEVHKPPTDQEMTTVLIQLPSTNNTSTAVLPTNHSSPNPICDSSSTTAKDSRTELVNDDRECDIPEHRDISNSVHTDSSEEFKTKRKRKKKISTKKRTKAREVPIPKAKVKLNNNNIGGEENPEEMFHMEEDYGENDDDEGYPSSSGGLSRSISLPVSSTLSNLVGSEWTARKMSSTFTGEFHPFSDGDVTPRSSPISSRPPSPMSDTEYEIQKIDNASPPDANGPSWGWGQLPNVPRKLSDTQMPNNEDAKNPESSSTAKEDESADAEKRSMLGGVLNFMRSTKKMRHMPESEGIYLSEINADELDPELAALYFPKFKSAYSEPLPVKDEDSESGKGPSLPHSPHTVEGSSYDGPNSQDSDSDDRLSFDQFSKEKCESISYPYSDIAMSLCGGLQDAEADLPEERFSLSVVTFDEFTENPAILQDSNLVIRIGGKYYNWLTAASMLTSIVMFQRPLPEQTTSRLVSEHMPKKKKSKSYSSWWSWRRSGEEGRKPEAENNKLEEESKPGEESKPEEESKSGEESKPGEGEESKLDEESNPETEDSTITEELSVPKNSDEILETKPEPLTEAKLESLPEANLEQESEEIPMQIDEVSSSTPDASSELVPEKVIGLDPEESVEITADSKEDVPSVNGDVPDILSESSASSVPIGIVSAESPEDSASSPEPETVAQEQSDASNQNCLDVDGKNRKEKYQKSLRLTSKQIIDLNLKEGPNEVVFSVTTAYQGTSRCTCHIFLWNYDDKIVISDIDGTITKSDVLGHILPMVGHNWAQLGVAKLFTKVKNNGYQFLYLSARAIGQARITREYLRSVRQGEIFLPDGPLLLSPTSLISALHREVIEKKPEEFKISCLKDIQTLFPSSMGNPFYAGFGNKINDTWAYRAVDIPITRVFTINHRGELKLELIQTFQSSYTRLSDEVDHVFPPVQPCVCVNGHPTPAFYASEEFSYFTYWREPVPAIHEDDVTVE